MQTSNTPRQPGDLVQVDGRWFEAIEGGGLTPYADCERAARISQLSPSTLEKDSLKPTPRFPVVRHGRRRLWLIDGLMPAA